MLLATSLNAFNAEFVCAASMQSRVESSALLYFLENAHPQSGLVRDRAPNFKPADPNNNVASIAATGFGLAVIANAGIRGMLPLAEAKDRVLRTLLFVRDHVPRRRGWFLHFVNWETGAREWECEYSTIDTALFLGGALYASEVLQSPQISQLAYELYRDTDFFDAMTDGGTLPEKRTLSMGYIEESGYIPWQWNMYGEQKLLLILGLGHPENPLPVETWLAWNRRGMGLGEALFVHQYSEAFLDFRDLDDGFENYFANGRAITEIHREKSIAGFWGFSAGDSPSGYRVWSAENYSTTVCIGCAVASVTFNPTEIWKDLEGWYNGPLQAQIWGRYGFTDSIDLSQNWFGPDVLGITVGPAYMAAANTEPATSIWNALMNVKEIKFAFARIGRPLSKIETTGLRFLNSITAI